MGSPDTVLRDQHRKPLSLTSKSYDPMEYATRFVRYEDHFDIKKTRPLYQGGKNKDIRNSMLAYTNYVTQRQKRNQIFSTVKNTITDHRRHTLEINENLTVHAKHIPHSGSGKANLKQESTGNGNNSNNVSAPSKIPVPKKSKVLKYKATRISDKPSFLRGNTFPPLAISNEANGFITSKKKAITSRLDHSNFSSNEEDSDHNFTEGRSTLLDHVQAWDDENSDHGQSASNNDNLNLSVQGFETKPFVQQNQKVTDASQRDKIVGEPLLSVRRKSKNMKSDNSKSTDLQAKIARKQYSEQLLKNAIETLKIMEKELDSKKNPTASNLKDLLDMDGQKVKIRVKKVKKLRMPKQKLDIIPELDCEYSFTSDEDSSRYSNKTPRRVRHRKKSRLDLNPIEESSDEESDIYSTESEHSENYDSFKTQDNSNRVYTLLPAIIPVEKGGSSNKGPSYKTKKNKAKMDIKSKIKKKQNKLMFLQQIQ